MRRVNWGILGVAQIAMNRVIPAMKLAANTKVLGIASRDAMRAQDAATKAGIERAYGSYEAMLEDSEIEAVYIPLPNHLHIEWCVKALEAGKHVLCEKPIAMDAMEAEVLIVARNRSGRIIEEAFSMRNHPQWPALRQVIDSDQIGAIRGVNTTMCYNNRDPKNIRNIAEVGGGALYDLGSYAVAGCRMVFDDEPIRAIGIFKIDPAFETDFLVSAILEFPQGQATINISTQAGPTTGGSHQLLSAIAERGWFLMDFPYAHAVPTTSSIFIGDATSVAMQSRRSISFNPVNQYLVQAERFSNLVLGEKVRAFPIEDSIANMRVLDALRRSGSSKQFEMIV